MLQQGETPDTRDWYRRIGKKIKLSLHKPRIEQRIDELRNFNSDFNVMTAQIIESFRVLEAKPQSIERKAGPGLAKYRTIREASQKLYDTLMSNWSCSTHPKHSAHICFAAEAPRSRTNGTTALVRLNMAVTYHKHDSTLQPIWLSVESTMDQLRARSEIRNTESLTQFTKFLQVQADQASAGSLKASSKDLLDIKGLMVPSPVSGALSDASSVSEDEIPDLSGIDDLCSHFEHEQNAPEQVCLGVFKDTCIQRFYHSSAKDRPTGSSSSLAEVISWIDENSIMRSLPRHTILALASSMAAAVLQYYSTPWLSESWQSQDIWFFGIEDLQQVVKSLESPHLNVDISRTGAREGEAPPLKAPSGVSGSYGARNELLFRLGVMLLELGFAKPWPMLKEKIVDRWPDPESRVTDYHAAEKLARRLVNSMGPQYSRITLKCLGCDFGLGESDLSSEQLQQTYLTDVVDALQSMQHRLSNISC